MLLEKFLEGETPTIAELKAGIRQATIDLKVFPVLCGSAFKNKGVQTLLDAVVDYLPSPLDKPPVEGIDPDHHDKIVIRKADDNEPLVGPGLQDHQRSLRQALLCPRLFGLAQDRRHDAQSAHRQDRPHRPPGEDARQQARGRDRDSGRRHLRLRGTEGTEDRRYALRAASSDRARRDHLPGDGDLGGHRAQDQGRPGKDGRRAVAAGRRGSHLQGADRRRLGPDDHQRHGRAASGNSRRPHEARAQGRGQCGRAQGGLPRDHPQEGRG